MPGIGQSEGTAEGLPVGRRMLAVSTGLNRAGFAEGRWM